MEISTQLAVDLVSPITELERHLADNCVTSLSRRLLKAHLHHLHELLRAMERHAIDAKRAVEALER